MYEIFGVAYGWNLSNEPARWLVQEDVCRSFGGKFPYSGGGEATTYIGIDVYDLDCRIASSGLTVDQFNTNVQRELKQAIKQNRFAQNVDEWRNCVLIEFEECLNNGDISQQDFDSVRKVIDREPTLFWTWSTS